MIRRRFVASVVAGLAGLFGAKVGRGEKVPAGRVYYACLRLSDGKAVMEFDYVPEATAELPPFNVGRCCLELGVATASSTSSLAHAIELAEAARLRYVITSAMKVNV